MATKKASAAKRTPVAKGAKALAFARQIIARYQQEIKDSAWTGVNLVQVGFCQGDPYRDALTTLDQLASEG